MGISQDVVSDYELNGPKKGRAVKEKGGQKVDYESKKPVLEGGKFSSVSLLSGSQIVWGRRKLHEKRGLGEARRKARTRAGRGRAL
jgi:hypothetical protein